MAISYESLPAVADMLDQEQKKNMEICHFHFSRGEGARIARESLIGNIRMTQLILSQNFVQSKAC